MVSIYLVLRFLVSIYFGVQPIDVLSYTINQLTPFPVIENFIPG